VSPEKIGRLGKKLIDATLPIAKRMRTIFTLRSLNTIEAIEALQSALGDPSALVGHEVAYCLGQMRNPHAVPALVDTLKNEALDPMVRHEAAEALGAIGGDKAVEVLHQFKDHSIREIRETCIISLGLLDWKKQNPSDADANAAHPVYLSVDPAPPSDETMPVQELKATLLNSHLSLFERYRAMFALRNIGTVEAIEALGDGLVDHASGPVFTHEIAYVLGQIQDKRAASVLMKALKDTTLNAMVRHEAAEALGSIADDPETMNLLKEYAQDSVVPVKESCLVALDIFEHNISGEFQYADGLYQLDQVDKE